MSPFESIPMSSPDLTAIETEAVAKVLQTRYLSIGPQVEAFEQAVASYVGTAHTVAVSSGTAGLHLAIISTGVGEGDLVITTPFSFVASTNCILYERAIPILADIDPQTLNIDPAQVAEAADALSQGGDAAKRWLPPAIRNSPSAIRNLKAILPVDVFGQPADMDPIRQVAGHHDLSIIEDACEAIGAEYKGCKVGTLGDVAVFAFYPNKQMTTGEGGIIVTDRDDWANLFRSLRNQGRDIFDAWLNHSRLGYNYRLNEMSAALGLVQMQRLRELLTKRERVANWYNERLADVELIERPYIAPTTTHMSWFIYVVRIKPPVDRNEVMRKLAEVGIPSRPYFTPIHLQPFYCQKFGYQRGDFPVTEYVSDMTLALPFSGVMTEEQIDYVCQMLQSVLEQACCGKVHLSPISCHSFLSLSNKWQSKVQEGG